MSKKQDYNERTDKTRRLLETIATIEGSESEFVQRKSKMTASCFSQTMIMGSLEKGDKTLTEYAQISADLGVEISASGLNQRINEKSVAMLKNILSKSIQMSQESELKGEVKETLQERFSCVQILDSSYLAMPPTIAEQYPGIGSSNAAGMKVCLNYEYCNGEIQALSLTPGREPDQKSQLHLSGAKLGSLHLFDLGFFKQEVFAELAQKGAYFISRYQSQTAVYWQQDDKSGFDLAAHLQKSNTDEVNSFVFLGSNTRVPVRLVAQRLPTKVAAERRRKAKQKAKRDGRRTSPTAKTLQLLDWVIFITNVPTTWLSIEQIILVYRLRWQIELIFKLWKSRAKLNAIGNYRSERVLCQVYARLTALVLFHSWVAPTYRLLKRLSLPKAFSLLQHHVARCLLAIADSWQGFSDIWRRFDHDLLRLGLQEKRKKSPNSYQLLLLAGL